MEGSVFRGVTEIDIELLTAARKGGVVGTSRSTPIKDRMDLRNPSACRSGGIGKKTSPVFSAADTRRSDK